MSIDLRPIFATVKGTKFIGIDTMTMPKLKGGRSNPMQGHITKVMKNASVMVCSDSNGSSYEAKVNRHLEKEGKKASFTVSARKWGHRLPDLPIVVNDAGEQYLETVFIKAGEVQYFYQGKPIAKEDIIGLEDKTEAVQGGLSEEAKIVLRDFKAESLRAVRIDGVEYKAA